MYIIMKSKDEELDGLKKYVFFKKNGLKSYRVNDSFMLIVMLSTVRCHSLLWPCF